MAYSTYQKFEEEAAIKLDNPKVRKDLDAIMGKFSFRQVLVFAKVFTVGLPKLAYGVVKDKLSDLIYGKPIPPKDSIGFVEGVDREFPRNSELEIICEQIAQEIEEEEKDLEIEFAGLIYHLFVGFDGVLRDQTGSGILENRKAMIDPEYYKTNHVREYVMQNGILFAPVRLYDSSKISESTEILPFNNDFSIHPDP